MTILKQIEDAKKLWNILLPHIIPPEDGVFAAWITRFPESAVEAGLIRGSKKFALRKVTASLDTATVYKYIAGVVRHESEAQKERNKMTQTPTPTNLTIEETLEEFQTRVNNGDDLATKAKVYVDAGAPDLSLSQLMEFVSL